MNNFYLSLYIYTGCDRPALKLLNKHVRKGVSFRWHDLGLELLEQEDEDELDEIRKNNPNNESECCKKMFQLWLRKYNNATWLQLIQALQEVDLNVLANKIEGMLMPMEETILHTNAGILSSYVYNVSNVLTHNQNAVLFVM